MKPYVVAVAVAFAVVSLYSAAPPPNAAKALIAGGQAPDLFLLYTGDVIGHVDPCG